jgi:hypothetical protein
MLTILDREGMLELANGFYGPTEAEYERLFPQALKRSPSQRPPAAPAGLQFN